MIHRRRTKSRRYHLRRITKLIDCYANDDQTLREVERVVVGWFAAKRKNKYRSENNKEG